jgi:hypothetical protein
MRDLTGSRARRSEDASNASACGETLGTKEWIRPLAGALNYLER